jgi:PAS domain S-box-containing protein
MAVIASLQSLWPRRLHLQLIAMVSALLVLALSLLGGYTANEQAQLERLAAEEHVSTVARNVAVASANLILIDSLDGLEELALRSADVGETRSLMVLGRNGDVLARVLRSPGQPVRVIYDTRAPDGVVPPPGAPAPSRVFKDGLIEAWHPVVVGELIGWVRVEHDTRALAADRWRIWRNTLVVAVVAVLVCVALLTAFLRRPMRSLARARNFAHSMVQLRDGLLPVESGPVEIVELRESLNEASVLLRQQMVLLEHNMGELQQHEAQLAEQNDQLGAIFRLSQDGLVTFDAQGCVRFVNQAFLSLTGLSESEMASLDLAGLSRRLQERAPPNRPFVGLEAVFAQQGDDTEPVVMEVEGERRKVLSLTGQCSQQGSVSRVLYVCDVTRQHSLDEMKSEFLSMAAHELRTPMVSIFGFTELMLSREMSAEQRKDLLGRIHRQSQSMVAILNELLDLARIEARRGQDFRIEDADLGELVLAVLTDHQPPAGRAQPTVVPLGVPMPVRVDRHKMQQAVLNILSNAYKYSPAGGDITVRFLRNPQGRFGVAIEDQGIGLSADHVARLGERFFRADKSGSIPGTGLGVSIVKELMDLMGGRMQVVSKLGQGTSVTLWL